MEDPLHLFDGDIPAGAQDGDRPARFLETARGVQPPEAALEPEVVQVDARVRIEAEPRRERRDDGLRRGHAQCRPPRDDGSTIPVVGDRDELGREVLEAAVHVHLPALELEEALLDQDRADLHADPAVALLRRARQAGRKVPRPVLELHERDVRTQRADPPEPQLAGRRETRRRRSRSPRRRASRREGAGRSRCARSRGAPTEETPGTRRSGKSRGGRALRRGGPARRPG